MTSPLDRQEQQPALPGMAAPAIVAAIPPHGGQVEDYTGTAFLKENPGAYREIVDLLAQGVPQAEIARQYNISRNLVSGILRTEMRGSTLEQRRQFHADRLRDLAIAATDKALELVADAGKRELGALAMIVTQATDKAELLSGHATSRVEIVAEPDADDYEQAVRRAKRTQIIDVDTGILGGTAGHCRAGDPAQGPALMPGKAADPTAAAGAIETVSDQAQTALSDVSSEVSPECALIYNELHTLSPLCAPTGDGLTLVGDIRAPADPDLTGGEGVSASEWRTDSDGYQHGEFQPLRSDDERKESGT